MLQPSKPQYILQFVTLSQISSIMSGTYPWFVRLCFASLLFAEIITCFYIGKSDLGFIGPEPHN